MRLRSSLRHSLALASSRPGMTSTAYYNEDHPLALLAAGTLQGKAVSVDTSSIRPCEGRPMFVASLTGGPALKLLCGGVPGTVAVKATEDDRTRAPRNPRREALLFVKLQHPNVRTLLPGATSIPLRFPVYTGPLAPQRLSRRAEPFFSRSPSHPLHALLPSHLARPTHRSVVHPQRISFDLSIIGDLDCASARRGRFASARAWRCAPRHQPKQRRPQRRRASRPHRPGHRH